MTASLARVRSFWKSSNPSKGDPLSFASGSTSFPEAPTLRRRIEKHLNFFRIHLIAFTIIPLIFSGIFYAADGRFKIAYIDSVFLCYSAMTVTGLSTVNLSTLTSVQQAILFVLMVLGDLTFVSWIMVLVRKNFFRVKCEELLRQDRVNRATFWAARTASRMPTNDGRDGDQPGRRDRLKRRVSGFISSPTGARPFRTEAEDRPVSASMASLEPGQLDREPVAVEPGLSTVLESRRPSERLQRPRGLLLELPSNEPLRPNDVNHFRDHSSAETAYDPSSYFQQPQEERRLAESPPPMNPRLLQPSSTLSPFSSAHPPLPSNPTPHFAPGGRQSDQAFGRRSTVGQQQHPMHRRGSVAVNPPSKQWDSRADGFGGFPNPLVALGLAIVPEGIRNRMRRPSRTTTMLSGTIDRKKEQLQGKKRDLEGEAKEVVTKAAKWLHFDGLIVGRNGRFTNVHELKDEELEEVGGVEYRALRLLSYFIAAYWIVSQLTTFLLIYPYLTTHSEWDSVFTDQPRLVSKPWFSAFQTLAAYSGGGLSLVDTSMVPFSRNYIMIIALSFVILAGNHALPIFLRFGIWVGTKTVPKDSEADETLHFLLDHPRRCFLYLFPSHQTWYLFVVLIFFIVTEWIAFGVLNIGLPILKDLSVGQQVIDGFFQSICVRASGFQIVSLAAVSPALQFLYIGLMYIAVFPIALSVRSTNVYEEQALGVYVREEGVTPEDPEPDARGSRGEVFSRYLLWHARKQLAFDIWPLAAAIFLVCIVERDMIMDEVNAPWFNVFRIVFEMVSAYATIGLSLGIPTQNYSFCGSFRTLSKLITICVMLRGRHRGLPQAIDRAILLPREFKDSKRKARSGSTNTGMAAGLPLPSVQQAV